MIDPDMARLKEDLEALRASVVGLASLLVARGVITVEEFRKSSHEAVWARLLQPPDTPGKDKGVRR